MKNNKRQILMLAELYDELASGMCGSPEAAIAWLTNPNYAFGYKRPLDLIFEPGGVQLVREELGRLQHGIFV